MDIFRILSRGASLNKGRKPAKNLSLAQQEASKQVQLTHQVEKETDFFHTKSHKIDAETPDNVAGDNNNNGVENEDTTPIDVPLKIASVEDGKKFRKLHKSNVSGDDIPLPVGSFEDLVTRFSMDKKLLTNLLDANFTEPTPIQCESIPISLNHRDLIACAPTGSGKTLAFLIPLMQMIIQTPTAKNHGVRGLVISPTNELAIQIFNQLETLNRGKNLKIAILSKQLAAKINNNIVNSSKFDIIVSTPLRLIDLVKKEQIKLDKVEQLVIDEADKLFDQGFVEQTDDILSNCTNVKLRKSMFSATIPSGVEEMANSIMKDPVRVIIGHKEAASATIEQSLVYTGNEEGKLLAIRQMLQQGEFKPPIIIFLQSIHRAKALFHELLYDKLNVDVIHAERTPKQRQQVIDRFKSGDVWVLITTDVIARGVDFHGVNMVINFDVPQSAQAYVHRIGRTGRNGKVGKAVTFFTKEDDQAVKPILNVMKQSGCKDGYSEWMEDMGKLSKNEKKKIRNHEIKRKQISTVPKIVKQKRRQREQMIDASKRRKTEEAKESND